MKQVRTATAFALVLGVAAASVTAEDETSEPHEMSAEHKAMMEAWEKAAKPGPQHRGDGSSRASSGWTPRSRPRNPLAPWSAG